MRVRMVPVKLRLTAGSFEIYSYEGRLEEGKSLRHGFTRPGSRVLTAALIFCVPAYFMLLSLLWL